MCSKCTITDVLTYPCNIEKLTILDITEGGRCYAERLATATFLLFLLALSFACLAFAALLKAGKCCKII